MGRTPPKDPDEKWGPRVIDLDIVFYGDLIMEEEGLVIPHPLAHERVFVILPVNEIAPDIVHPVLKTKVSELAGMLKGTGYCERVQPE
jgi:2-amino-4-hydroxy-6-hydroxymethyldihydropteridine diphosphokinase